ncbi:hypothetical protein WB334_26425, partial [Escherichia coli]|uniref:YdeI family protein n=1 Tax=Escherichia coli TaxID=562 RepID=UPI0034D1C2D4|nr:hypothetical protein [Escherichia coli]
TLPERSTLPVLMSAADLKAWLEENGDSATEYWFAIHKKTSPDYSVSLDDLVDVALCFGWVDVKGIRVDDNLRGLRFTPRRAQSNWSDINRERARKLIAAGRMRPAGAARLPEDL